MNVMLGPPRMPGNRAQALIERAKAGVKAHLLFGALGSGRIDEKSVKQMKAAGVEVGSSVRSFEKKGVFLRHRFMKVG